ncbi:MAG: helix-turn-helix domain-containing protein [Lachnospiraceae bacterium]|nr:helix-turn-helix domain-containing protein [Lachnospiraceae bacterium]
MKYSYEIKLKAVKALKKGILIKEPYNKISRHWRDIVKHWEKIYDKHGEDGLKRQYRKHTYKEKLNAVKEVVNGNSINQVSINRNMPIKSIVDWVKIYRQNGISGLKCIVTRSPLMKKKDNEIKKRIEKKESDSIYTKEEIEYILAENAYLKKLHALVQEKNQKNQK